MFLKSYILKQISKIDTQLQHKIISPELATPRSIACLLLGYQLYIKFIDNQVRKQISIEKNNQKVFVNLLLRSQNQGSLIQKSLIATGLFTALYSFNQTRNKIWLYGGSLFIIMLAYELLLLKPIKQNLLKSNIESQRFISEKKQMQNSQKVFNLLKKWKERFNYKIGITILTIFIFYAAEIKYSQKVDMKFSLKK